MLVGQREARARSRRPRRRRAPPRAAARASRRRPPSRARGPSRRARRPRRPATSASSATAGVRHREAGVGLQRLGEPLLAVGAVGQQVVHALLEALEGDGRIGGDGQAVTVGERHGKGPQTSRASGSSIRSASAPEELGAAGAVEGAVVAGEREHHGRLHGRLAVDRDDAIGDAPHGQDRGLRRVDDGAERVHAVHAEVADREDAALDVGRPQLAGLRPRHQVLATGGDLLEPQRVGLVDHRDDEPVLQRDGEADVDVGVPLDRAVLPRHVHARMLRQRRRHQLDQQVRVGDVRARLLARRLSHAASRADVDLAHQVEVRRARPRRGHPLRHDPPHRPHPSPRTPPARLPSGERAG